MARFLFGSVRRLTVLDTLANVQLSFSPHLNKLASEQNHSLGNFRQCKIK
jgi:hypothetical protein